MNSDLLCKYVRPGDSSVLVVGCGDGSLGKAIKEAAKGREVWGIEAEVGLAEIARTKLDRVITGKIERLMPLPLPPGKFDCIVCEKGFAPASEHVNLLEKLKTQLTPRGQVVCQVPNLAHWRNLQALLNGEMPPREAIAVTPFGFRCALFEARMKLLTEDAFYDAESAVLEPLVAAAARFGVSTPDACENLAVIEKVFVAEPAPPVVLPSAGSLEPASLPGVSVIVLSYNSTPTLQECVGGVLATLRPGDELILVNNASRDGSQELIKSFEAGDGRVRAILNNENLGFSAGCNVGIRASRGSFICLLNPDTKVWPGWLESLSSGLSDPQVGMVGPLSDSIAGAQFVGHHLSGPRLTPEQLAGQCKAKFPDMSLETKLLIGLCVMLRRETLNEVGLLDEDLFLGSDDLELSWRLWTHGLQLLAVMDAFIHHEGGVSFKTREKTEVSKLLFESTEKLLAKTRAWSGWHPPDQLVWGIEITHR